MNTKTLLRVISYFVISSLLVILCSPKEIRFHFQFSAGKPWQHGLLTAPFDIPIYKPSAQLDLERDSAIQHINSYFRLDRKGASQAKAQFEADLALLPNASAYRREAAMTRTALSLIYRQGILSLEDYERVFADSATTATLLNDHNKASKLNHHTHSTITAYKQLRQAVISKGDSLFAQHINLARYVTPNLIYDEATTEKVKDEAVRRIPLATGMVQTGEKIIDRGEIITPEVDLILESLRTTYQRNTVSTYRIIGLYVGLSLLIIGCYVIFFFYTMSLSKRMSHGREKYMLFMVIAATIPTLMAQLAANTEWTNIYMVPLLLFPMAVIAFYDYRSALFAHLTSVLLASFATSFAWDYVIMQFIGGTLAIYTLRNFNNRWQLFRTALIALSLYIIVYMATLLFHDGDISRFSYEILISLGINFLLFLFSYGLIFVMEKLFGLVSTTTLIELGDINHPLLRELSERCPGSFQHSLQVSFIAAEAIRAIGGNVNLSRTGALYHDIGKLSNPSYFTENQSSESAHNHLTSIQSARVIINHITEGVRLAEQANLPKPIIDMIRTHHGRGITRFFYNSYCNDNPGKVIDPTPFSYEGPNPSTREQAVLMLADCVEAASRSLKTYTEEAIENLVTKIVDAQLADGLLNEAPITLAEISKVKGIFTMKLKTMYHSRIEYPELIATPAENETPTLQ